MNIHDQDIYFKAKNEGIEEGFSQGIAQGSQEKAIETAKNFLALGFPIEQVAQGTGLSLEFLKTLK